jgi:archaeal flagellin N-terminal-like domain
MINKRAVSNIVAEIMMILVTLAVGFTLIVYLSSAAEFC